jgi:hypothetical protein
MGVSPVPLCHIPISPQCIDTCQLLPCLQLEEADHKELADKFNAIIDHLRATYPVVQRFKTLQERNLEELRQRRHNAFPTVPASSLGRSVAATQVCGLDQDTCSGGGKGGPRGHLQTVQPAMLMAA